MDKKVNNIKEVRIDRLVPFKSSMLTYEGKRFEMLVNSIDELGLQNPIIVRPIEYEKYQIISGHNRVKALKALGNKTVKAYIKRGITDEEAEQIYFDTNLNQQNFNDWKYSQRIEAVKYYDKLIRKTSQQGKRNDLNKSTSKAADATTSVYVRQKSQKAETDRDRMARCLGISTALFSRYRSIIKLPDNVVERLASKLDERVITFDIAYTLSKVKIENINVVLDYMDKNNNVKINTNVIKELKNKYGNSVLTEEMIKRLYNEQENIFEPIRKS